MLHLNLYLACGFSLVDTTLRSLSLGGGKVGLPGNDLGHIDSRSFELLFSIQGEVMAATKINPLAVMVVGEKGKVHCEPHHLLVAQIDS
uniref:Uncharacterized protein n=1 Tax=Nelumbo nucifera TaxID=4432 RepID=A0A822ZTL7_NELNU|nr:TPA_asm: hypothetical protein HUJ06_016642 [Nelumbo nucifera]